MRIVGDPLFPSDDPLIAAKRKRMKRGWRDSSVLPVFVSSYGVDFAKSALLRRILFLVKSVALRIVCLASFMQVFSADDAWLWVFRSYELG